MNTLKWSSHTSARKIQPKEISTTEPRNFTQKPSSVNETGNSLKAGIPVYSEFWSDF